MGTKSPKNLKIQMDHKGPLSKFSNDFTATYEGTSITGVLAFEITESLLNIDVFASTPIKNLKEMKLNFNMNGMLDNFKQTLKFDIPQLNIDESLVFNTIEYGFNSDFSLNINEIAYVTKAVFDLKPDSMNALFTVNTPKQYGFEFFTEGDLLNFKSVLTTIYKNQKSLSSLKFLMTPEK